ncbi:MAG: hypothetical protein E7399_05250 [Ruminococcaceae bacterium]|nr:hypothetical protein [Oscillospiraceae bacterium]
MNTENRACCVFGHRKVEEKNKLKEKLTELFEQLIVSENVTTFYLGSKSEFNDLCCKVLAVKKEKYPHIQRVYVRGEYPCIDENYENYLLESYEKTYFPQRAIHAGKAVYVERNREMIDQSEICIVYYKNNYLPPKRKSGTAIAYQYALQKKKIIINLADRSLQ